MRYTRINKGMFCMWTLQEICPPPHQQGFYPRSNYQNTTPCRLSLSPPHRSHPCTTIFMHGNILKSVAKHHNLTPPNPISKQHLPRVNFWDFNDPLVLSIFFYQLSLSIPLHRNVIMKSYCKTTLNQYFFLKQFLFRLFWGFLNSFVQTNDFLSRFFFFHPISFYQSPIYVPITSVSMLSWLCALTRLPFSKKNWIRVWNTPYCELLYIYVVILNS
jgi:hypothetical protein